jgi:hypothetical protein
MKTLNEQYKLIKEGKGHKGVFLTESKRQFPQYITNSATFEQASHILKQRGVINENIIGITPINSPFNTKEPESFELAFNKFLGEAKKKEEDEKAELKKPSKQVEDKEEKTAKKGDKKEDKTFDNMIFDQIMKGYYAELKDPKNCDKTMEELKAIVLKNLEKDPIHYTKDGQFGVKGLGYTTEAPGLGTPKELKGKYKGSGYGDLKESLNNEDDLEAIKAEAKRISKEEGVSQHVNKDRTGYHIDDFFDSDNTVATYINGELNESTIGKNYPEFITGEYEGKPQRIEGSDLHDMLMSGLDSTNSLDAFIKYVIYGVTDENNDISDEDKQKLTAWYNQNKDMNIQEQKLRKAINTIIREELAKKPLNENVDKRLKEIELEAANEAMGSKLEKIVAEIEKRNMQLGKLDEDEDLKAMMDKKVTGKIQKEIKLLERAKAKVEKIMSKGKGKKKEVIDEDDAVEAPEDFKAAIDKAEQLYDELGTIEDVLDQFPEEQKGEVERHLRGAYGL